MSSDFFEEIPEEPKNTENNSQQPSAYPQPPYPPYPYPPYPPTNNMALASLIFGCISVFLFCCPYLSLPCSVIAIILGILSKKGMPMQKKAIAGIVLGILGLLIFIALIAYAYVLSQDPEFMEYFNQIMEKYQQQGN